MMAALFHANVHRQPGRRPGRRQRPALWLACGLAWAASAGAQSLQAGALADRDFAQQVLDAVNHHRVGQQLAPWQSDPMLSEIAAGHSQAMARLGALSHEGFPARFERARRQVCVENLAARYRRADHLVAGWRVSPGHAESLLDPRVQQVGVASVDGYVTLLACSAAPAAAAR